MDVETVNSILQAFIEILPQIGLQNVEKKGVSASGPDLANKGVIINIAVTGSLKGAILIGMEVNSAKSFASKMMMGMEVAELDGLAQSAISEMGNMVCANSCTRLSQAGYSDLDISPPILLIGAGGQIRLPIPKILVVHLAADGIPLEVYIGLTK